MAKVFCSYSHKDERLRRQLVAQLSVLIRDGGVELWSDHAIRPGDDFDAEIKAQLESADLILFLVSPDFLNSGYCYDVEVRIALERWERREVRVIPIILRYCDWERTPLSKFEVLPEGKRPVRAWPDRDLAFKSVVDGLWPEVAGVNRLRQAPAAPTAATAPVLGPDDSAAPLKVADLLQSSRTTHAIGVNFNALDPDGFLHLVAHVSEILEDLELGQQDNRHAAKGGVINYVFDENILELFVEPYRFHRWVEMFHTGQWSELRETDRSMLRSINTQSALLTGEYLFSGNLPGQREGKIYQTAQHRREFLARAEYIQREVAERMQGPEYIRLATHQLFRFRERLRAAASPQDEPQAGQPGDLIRADVETLRKGGIAPLDLESYSLTRTALEELADEIPMSSLFQVRRIMGEQMRRSFHAAEALGPPPTSARLRESARDWRARLRQEAERKAHGKRVHPALSLDNDALALALVEHLAHESEKRGELTVLVTGDRLIYAAYRRWYLESEATTPFILRRVSQYAPLFTLGDPDIVEARSRTALAQSLELALLPLSVTLASNQQHDHERNRRLLVQTIEDGDWRQEPLVSHLRPMLANIEEEVGASLSKLWNVWQLLERLMLGLNSDLLGYRMAQWDVEPLTRPDASGEELQKWLRSMVGSLELEANVTWLPLAIKAIDRFRAGGSAEPEESAFWERQNFDFRPGAPGSTLAITAELSQLREYPVLAFAAAAALASELKAWSEAERYASLCAAAARLEEDPGRRQHNLEEARRLATLIGLRQAKVGSDLS